MLKSEERRFALFQKTRKIGIILDEVHKIKNPDETEITKTFHKLRPGFVRRVIMTGTPVANRPYDIWAPIISVGRPCSSSPITSNIRGARGGRRDHCNLALKRVAEPLPL